MRVISKATLVAFWQTHPASKHALQTWFEDASRAEWRFPQDIKLRYASASFVAPNRVVFNIKGNSYRPVAAIDFEKSIVFIKWIGTHEGYDRIDVLKVQHGE